MAKLYFRHSAMGGGKTASLLQVKYNYEQKGRWAFLMKPAIDTKGADTVVSRIGISAKVDALIGPDDMVIDKLKAYRPDAIIVDEAQFLTPSQVDELFTITKLHNIPVLCYGLRTDFQMKGFPGATRLLEIADDIEELKTICTCGKKATQNLRKLNETPTFEGEQVVIDNSDVVSYEAVCGECYLKLKKRYSTK